MHSTFLTLVTGPYRAFLVSRKHRRKECLGSFCCILQCSVLPARKICVLRCAALSGKLSSYSALFCLNFRLPTLLEEIQTSQLGYAKYLPSCRAGFSKHAVAFSNSSGTAECRTTFSWNGEWLWCSLKTGTADSLLPLTELHFMSACVCVPSFGSRPNCWEEKGYWLRIYDGRWVRHRLAPHLNGESTVTKRT